VAPGGRKLETCEELHAAFRVIGPMLIRNGGFSLNNGQL